MIGEKEAMIMNIQSKKMLFLVSVMVLGMFCSSPCQAEGFWQKTKVFCVSIVLVPYNAVKGLFYRSERKVIQAEENVKDNLHATGEDFKLKVEMAKRNIHAVFDQTQSRITQSVDAAEAAFDKLQKRLDNAVFKQEVIAAREKLLKDLVQTRDDLLWINQGAYVTKLLDGELATDKVIDHLKVPDYVEAIMRDAAIAKSTKQAVVCEWLAHFLVELEHEEKILKRIEHELAGLIIKAERDNFNCRQFVPDAKEASVKTTSMKRRIHELLNVIEMVLASMMRNLNK